MFLIWEKRHTTPFQTFRVNYRYKGVLPSYKMLKEEVVSETSAHYPPIYDKSSCVLTYNNLQNLSIQVFLRDNFKVKLDEIYFSYVFLNEQPYQTYMDKKGFEAYMSQLNFATHCASTACGISSEDLLTENEWLEASIISMLFFRPRKFWIPRGTAILTLMTLTCSRVSITSKSTEALWCFDVDPSTDWRYKYDERSFIQDGKTGHYVMANSAMGWIQDHSFGLTQIGIQKLSESV